MDAIRHIVCKHRITDSGYFASLRYALPVCYVALQSKGHVYKL
ncbi:MAG: hypothetical protein Q8O31_07060 [Rhodocyclaceae bacterium]|nr:hypothetical protein [Rhodocyclaceae bacterium]